MHFQAMWETPAVTALLIDSDNRSFPKIQIANRSQKPNFQIKHQPNHKFSIAEREMSRKRVLVVGGTGYLGQHLLQGFSEIQATPYDLGFTYHSNLPQPLLHAIPHLLPFHVDLKTGQGFESISHSFGQVCVLLIGGLQIIRKFINLFYMF